MTLETKMDLNEETVIKLQELIRVNVDSEQGFRDAAKTVNNYVISQTFESFAQQRTENIRELQEFVCDNGEEPVNEGSYAGKVHRLWMDLRGKLNAGNSLIILTEAERGEDYIKEAYEETLKAIPGSAMNDVILRQYAGVKVVHDRVRNMRNAQAAVA